MDKHEYLDRDYHYPTSPVYCKNKSYLKCEDADCNDQDKYKHIKKCLHCQIWRWRFVETNELVVGEWFLSANEAEYANEKSIERSVLKEEKIRKINERDRFMVSKFKDIAKKAKMSNGIYPYFNKTPSPKHKPSKIASSPIALYCAQTDMIPSTITEHNNKTSGMVSVSPKKRCVHCNSYQCHDEQFGPYLSTLGQAIFKKEEYKTGDKTDMEMIDSILRQRYHVLAECDSFNSTGNVEFEYKNCMDLPECIKTGHHFRLMSSIRKTK